MSPPQARAFAELLADSLLLLKEGCAEWALIISAGQIPGLAATALACLLLGATDLQSLLDVLARDRTAEILPLFLAAVISQICNALALIAVARAAAARDEGRTLGVRRAFAEALPRLLPFALAQLRALAGIAWGLVRLLWPGLKLCVLYAFVPIAVIVEDERGGAALERSAEIAALDAPKTLGNLSGAAALAALVYAGLAVVLAGVLALPKTVLAGGQSLPEIMIQGYLRQLLGGLVLGWVAGFAVLLYRDLAAGGRRERPQAESPRAA